jgi:hypothetical protein
MPMYQDISYDDLRALQHYIRQRADAALAAEGGDR